MTVRVPPTLKSDTMLGIKEKLEPSGPLSVGPMASEIDPDPPVNKTKGVSKLKQTPGL